MTIRAEGQKIVERIRTEFWAKPIPIRNCDWIASYDNDEPDDEGNMTCGYGATEQEAIDDLLLAKPPTCGDCGGVGAGCANCDDSGERPDNDPFHTIEIVSRA
jgi:hypothetical protein